MKRIVRKLNSIESNFLIWGDPFNSKGKDIIICITGNPGVTDYYIEFAATLHHQNSMPICVIGQAGHEEVSDDKSNILENQEHLFNLEGQIKHKLDLINNCIDKSSKLHLIGHSIGAWLIVELLHRNPTLVKRVSSINLLFPTVQRMASSPSGMVLNNKIRKIHKFLLVLIKLLHVLPTFIIKLLIHLYLIVQSLPSHYYERICKTVHPLVMEKVLFLAFDEMDSVCELNREGIEEIKHFTNVIYSSTDKWAPLRYMEDLKDYEPYLQLKEVDVDHAFVLRSSKVIANYVTEYIKTKC